MPHPQRTCHNSSYSEATLSHQEPRNWFYDIPIDELVSQERVVHANDDRYSINPAYAGIQMPYSYEDMDIFYLIDD